MVTPQRIPVLAIVNASEEVTAMLAALFRMEGFRVVSAFPIDLKRGQPDPATFLRQHAPQVVVWDIGIPYEENWAFFQLVQENEADHGGRFVVTTTNKAALERLVGATAAHEVLGKPYDLNELVAAVRRAQTAGC